MKKSRHDIARHMARAAALLAGCLSPFAALAQVRTEASPASLVNPATSAEAQAMFERSGLFMVAGGVVPAGHAVFLLDQDGTSTPLPAASVHPVVLADGSTGLQSGGATFAVGMPGGLACPLGQFVARDGMVAYTVPKYIDPDSRAAMRRAGLVRHRIAHEFDGTIFEKLLKAADFGATEQLPPALTQQIIAGINQSNGITGMVINASDDLNGMIGSYINSGMQVTYRVYLSPRTGRVEIGGVPLRYFWKMEQNNSAGVFSVEMYAQDWPAGTRLTDLTAPDAKPTQYDVVNFYQVAGMFAQLHESDAAGFSAFVDQACSKADAGRPKS
jgi:hypothetical protein